MKILLRGMKESHILYPFSVLVLRMKTIINNIWNRNTYIVLHEQKKPVKVALWPGPSNPKDANAIAIDMNYGTRRIHVGYIASELCKYLNPLITGDIVHAFAYCV